MLHFRDRTTIIPSLRDPSLAGVSTAPLSEITIAQVGTFFTETMHLGGFVEAIAFLQVTANSGTTPTIDIKFQLSPDEKQWVDAADAFTQVTTTNGITFKKLTANFGRYVRAVITLGGTTPSYTFTLKVVAKG